MRDYKLTLNLVTNEAPDSKIFKQYDTGNEIELELYQNEHLNPDDKLVLSSESVLAFFKRQDGVVLQKNCTIRNGNAIVKTAKDVLGVPGILELECMVKKGDVETTTTRMTFTVEESIARDGAIEDDPRYTSDLITELLDVRDNVKAETIGKIEEVASQLEESEKKVVDVKNVFNSNINNAYLGFIFDDQRKEVYDNAYPVFKQEGIVGSLAIIVNGYKQADATKVSPRDLQTMYNDGWEMLSHGIRSLQITSSVDEEFAKSEIIQSKKELEKLGFEINGFVAPNNLLDVNRMNYVEDTYEFAFCNYSNLDVDNTKSIYNINRYDMSNKTVAQLKAIIDNAVVNNKVIFFYEHNVGVEGSISIADLAEVIQYAKSKNIIIDTPSKIIDKVSSALIKGKSLKSVATSIDYSNNILINPHFKGKDSSNTNNWSKSTRITEGAINFETRQYLPFSEYIMKFGGVAQNDYCILTEKIPYKSNLSTTGKIQVPIYANGTNRSIKIIIRVLNGSEYLYDLSNETIIPSLTSSIYEASFAIPKDLNITHIEIRLQVISLAINNTFNFFIGSPCLIINNFQRDTKDYLCTYLNANQTLSLLTESTDTILFNNVSISTGGLNTTTGEYTVTQDGVYKIEASVSVFGTEDFISTFNLIVSLNGVASRQIKDYRNSIANKPINLRADALLQLKVGDVIKIDLSKSLAKSLIVDRASYLNIYKIAD